MANLPAHGTMRRYRAGCHCIKCNAKNTEVKATERARKRERDGKATTTPRAPRRAVPTVPTMPTAAAPAPPTEPDAGSVAGALALALVAVEADDPLTLYRKAHALRLASVLDDLTKPHLWRGITTALAEVLAALLGDKSPEDGEAAVLREFMETIGASRRGRGSAKVRDPAEPGA
ncbi:MULTISPECIES: hypothetical protein [unclassified Cryobacterium]|uniref:hypothetical protein n=1 Tax=unclassified Cryobacterium TaxID=2649013 RepID=UPI002AB3F818|nr:MULTISPECIES: hypothetical protein [unclassified Cryobacterium]MDY7528461.1 hypothetical protein [Cryobacterium sp. 10C2]MDY7555794.1 hypothetical protein [Cryobacterium sp. 10C3]MEB0286169.1 hypothetical protein [Cryobacterium sp. 10S3]MEB0289181.1 hypothetical protein [Cryobacterium sp. 10C2]WPX12227.1 hypothetical protein RHM57_11090 [Cryobacterium sp. 10S3]